jgi:hypothetical protein
VAICAGFIGERVGDSIDRAGSIKGSSPCTFTIIVRAQIVSNLGDAIGAGLMIRRVIITSNPAAATASAMRVSSVATMVREIR